jgi:hypothetical protein
MTTVEILRAARADIADPTTWWKGGPHGGDSRWGTYCALLAVGNHVSDDCSHPAVIALARACGGEGPGAIIRMNDAERTTHAEVLAAFDRAIAIAEAVEQEHAPVHLDAAIPERLPEVAA